MATFWLTGPASITFIHFIIQNNWPHSNPQDRTQLDLTFDTYTRNQTYKKSPQTVFSLSALLFIDSYNATDFFTSSAPIHRWNLEKQIGKDIKT